MKKIISIQLLLISGFLAFAQNPILPPGLNLCDPSPRVWNDGKVYFYCSHDFDINDWTGHSNYAVSSENLIDWEVHKDIFSSKGENDQVPYNDAKLWAPDCMYRDGKYYFYFCQPDLNNMEGVAVSENPTGPFSVGKPIDLKGFNQIDPAVFIDDDGQAYYIWGQFDLNVAKLNRDMVSLDESSIHNKVITENEHHFHEGAFMAKRNGIYYLIYADISRAGMPTSIGYATSSSPFGPYKYGGVIVDNDHSDPQVWNNHGGIFEYKGNWYVAYHRSSHNVGGMRRACIEPIFFNPDGSIPEVEMTSQGAGLPLDAFKTIEAERACLVYGTTYIQLWSDNNEELTGMNNADRAAYKYIDFGKGNAKTVEFTVSPGTKAGKISVNIGKSWHQQIAVVDIPVKQGNEKWITVSANLAKVEGVHELWLTFLGEGNKLFSVDKFVFK
jgi:beta-xylosidase